MNGGILRVLREPYQYETAFRATPVKTPSFGSSSRRLLGGQLI
jgi:hypothetical protein